MDYHFSENDIAQMKGLGIEPEQAADQMNRFSCGFPYARLTAPATPEKGIRVLTGQQTDVFSALYDEQSPALKVTKFVPASGAASRMFSHLFTFRDTLTLNAGEAVKLSDEGISSPAAFFKGISKLAFACDLNRLAEKEGHSLDALLADKNYLKILNLLLDDAGLNYAQLPKALIKFHKYGDESRTAAEEHFAEARMYCLNSMNIARLHFTLSPGHVSGFYALAERAAAQIREMFGITLDLSHSLQKPSTDTIAAIHDNHPFRDESGKLVFRPGGHGALLENLNELDADIVFIKNIDNVVPDRLKPVTVLYKKAIGGYLLSLCFRIRKFMEMLIKDQFTEADKETMLKFIKDEFHIRITPGDNGLTATEDIIRILNRPVRVCGMVRNTGEPGGGPFFVSNSAGEESLQIVESSQIDLNDPAQKKIFSESTHFNPVDLVCSLKDYRGRKFDLKQFTDPETGFISEKTKDGRRLRAMELPGLWNGAMASWNTVFVEVPAITFNPVKTVNDLLRSEHLEEPQ